MRLHPAWPDVEGAPEYVWDYPDPVRDLAHALNVASGPTIPLIWVAAVEEFFIDSNDGRWTKEGDGVGTELSMVLIGTLTDGRWFALEAWNDYTGWGCQDGADIYAGPTREDVIANGLTNSGCLALGLPEVIA